MLDGPGRMVVEESRQNTMFIVTLFTIFNE